MNAMTDPVLSLPPRRISTPALRRALIAGARRVIADRDVLNRINVFPVADGDTGNNMAFTLGTVLSGALRRRAINRSAERRVGKECVSSCRSRWSAYN